MPTFNQGIRTEAGQDLFGRVDSGQTSIHYTKIVYSSLDLSNKSDDEIAQMTDVNPKELIVPNPSVLYKPKTATTDPETEIRAIGSNEILQKGFYINTYALFASDDSGHEILLGVTLDDHPSWLPAYDGVRPQALTYNWDIGDKDSNNVKFTDANDAYATYADLQQYSSAIDYSMNEKASGINNSMSSYSNTFDSIKSGMANDSTISNISSTASQNSNDVAALYGSTGSNASKLSSYSNKLSILSGNMADNSTMSNLSNLEDNNSTRITNTNGSVQALSGSVAANSNNISTNNTNIQSLVSSESKLSNAVSNYYNSQSNTNFSLLSGVDETSDRVDNIYPEEETDSLDLNSQTFSDRFYFDSTANMPPLKDPSAYEVKAVKINQSNNSGEIYQKLIDYVSGKIFVRYGYTHRGENTQWYDWQNVGSSIQVMDNQSDASSASTQNPSTLYVYKE